jgi:hypothetical protein
MSRESIFLSETTNELISFHLNISRYLRSFERSAFVLTLRRFIGFLLNQLTRIDFLLSNNRNQYEIKPKVQNNSKLFVYVARARLSEDDKKIIAFFKENSFYTLIIAEASFSENIACDLFVVKSPKGRDLGALRDVARSLSWTNLTVKNLHFLMLNDSMLWDRRKLNELLLEVNKFPPNTFVFPTESFFPRHHVQPYLISIKLEGRRQIEKFSNTFEWIRNLHWKRSFVAQIEYKLNDELVKRNWRNAVIVPYYKIVNIFESVSDIAIKNQIRGKLNPTQHFWLFLGFFGLYGIKKSLLFSNPCNIVDTPESILDGQNRMLYATKEIGRLTDRGQER